MSKLKALAPADLVTILEHATNERATCRQYTNFEGLRTGREVHATIPSGHIALRFRTPKTMLQVEVSPYLLATNPDLHQLLDHWRVKRSLMDELVIGSAWDMRRYNVPPKGAQALASCLMAMAAPAADLPLVVYASPLFVNEVKGNLGSPVELCHTQDWAFDPKLTGASTIKLGPRLPIIICTERAVWVSSGGLNHRCTLHTWVMEEPFGFISGNTPEELVRGWNNHDGRSVQKFRKVESGDLQMVMKMIAAIPGELSVKVEESDFVPTRDDGVSH